MALASLSAAPGTTPSRRYEFILIALCLVAALKFFERGVVRATWNSGDFREVYWSAQAFSRGLDPYDPAVVTRMRVEDGGVLAHPGSLPETHALYPPATYVLLYPFALLSWRSAKIVWCTVNLLALAVFAMCLHRLADIRWQSPRSLLLIAFLLALEPASTAVMLGQLSIVVAALAAASMLALNNRSETLGGFFEGVALGLKPQVAAAYLAPYILARRRAACTAVGLTLLTLYIIALAGLRPHSEWLDNYQPNVEQRFGKGAAEDFFAVSAKVVQLINLRYPLSVLLGDNPSATYLAAATALILAVPPFVALVRGGGDDITLHCISILTVVELMFSYHRGYDAIIIGFPIAWGLSPRVMRRHAVPALAAAAMFILPSGVAVSALGQLPWFPAGISEGLPWNGFVVPYQAWALVLMASWMNYCLLLRKK